MFVGHALLAFAVAALVADWRGWEPRSALFVGAVAGAFAAIPDIDVAYAVVGLLEWQTADSAHGAPSAFWGASRAVHRSVTHSLVVGAVAAPAFGFVAVRGHSARARFAHTAGTGLLVGLVAVAFVWDGPLAALVMGLFVASGALIARAVVHRSTLPASTIAVAALWGLSSHPWGDLVTGSPPDWFFPFPSPVLQSRVVLHSDPTLHLLGAFAIELATIWLALVTICRLTDRPVLASVDRRAAAAATYGLAALAATPPTLEVSYHFVFSILGVGALCGAVRGTASARLPRSSYRRLPSFDSGIEIALAALTAVTVALAAYTTVYLLVHGPV